MAKRDHGIHRLTERQIATLGEGLHADGGGLYLAVRGKSRTWQFRTRKSFMGLGATHTLNATEARERARLCRQQLLDGIDPIEARKAARLEQQLDAAKNVTFREVAEAWFKRNAGTSWEPPTMVGNRSRLETYIYPKIGSYPIQKFDMRNNSASAVDLVRQVVEPLWRLKGEKPGDAAYPTGELVRQHIEGVLNRAIAVPYISGDNAASLNGPLGELLPDIKKKYRPTHHASLPCKEAPAFMAKLRACTDNTGALQAGTQDRRCQVCSSARRDEIDADTRAGATLDARAAKFGINRNTIWAHYRNHAGKNLSAPRRPLSAYAIELLILTGVRKGQVLKAEWDRIDWEDGLLICPWQNEEGEQGHKVGKQTRQDHIIPLSNQALVVLKAMKQWQEANGIKNDFVFPGGRGGTSGGHMSNTAVNNFLKGPLGRPDLTIHGFRSTFGEWSVEAGYDDRDSEMALGHVVGNGVRNIYKRNAHRIEPRRLMMQAWADYCDRGPLPAEVIPIRAANGQVRSQ